MVFLRLHHVNSLTFPLCFICFPIFDLSSLGIQERKDTKQKQKPKKNLNFAPLKQQLRK